MIVHLNLEDSEGGGFTARVFYMNAANQSAPPDRSSPAHCAMAQLLRYLDMLAQRCPDEADDLDAFLSRSTPAGEPHEPHSL